MTQSGPSSVSQVRRLRPDEFLRESLGAIAARPGRTVLTALGTALGVGAIVATLGIAQSASAQIGRELDQLRATSLTAGVRTAEPGAGTGANGSLPRDASVRAERLNGVVAAATLTEVTIDPMASTRGQVVDDARASPIQLIATDARLLEVIGGRLQDGVFFDPVHDGQPVAVLGPLTAERLGVGRLEHQPAIFVGLQPLTVIGIIEDLNLPDGLADAVLITDGTAAEDFGWTTIGRIVVRTQIGATEQVATEIGVSLSPDAPQDVAVLVPPEPTQVRSDVDTQLNTLVLALGSIALVIGGLGIANVTLVSVLERTGEIGIRRALGARRGQIAMHFLTESVLLGLIGGVVGTSVGVLAVVAVTAARDWVPVLEPWIPLGAPIAGLFIGLVAGLYPAIRAARMQAADAIRAGDR